MYDFNTMANRRDQSSIKWNKMFEKNPYVQDGIIPFSVADLDFKSPPELVKGIQRYVEKVGVFGYTTPNKLYYNAINNWMKKRHDWLINDEWIVTSPGIIPAINVAINAYTKIGDGVIIFTPVYYPFLNAIQNNFRNVIDCPLMIENGNYVINFEHFEKEVKEENNKLLLFCSPHNPVGRVWKKDEIETVARMCKENNVIMLSDEIHSDIIMPGYKHLIIHNIAEKYADNVVICTAPTKSFNIAGLQISNILISNNQLREAFIKEQRRVGTTLINSLSIKACEIVYNECETWLDELINLIYINNMTMKSYIYNNIPEIKVYPLEGTYLLWMDCNSLGYSVKKLDDIMEDKAQVFFDAGYLFGDCGNGFLRMNIACSTTVLEQALERMKSAINKKE